MQPQIHFPDGGDCCQFVLLLELGIGFPAVEVDRSKSMMDSLEQGLSGILIIVCNTCKESSHFSPLLQIIMVSLYMLLIDSICEMECLNLSHALHLPVYYNMHYFTSRGCLIQIRLIWWKMKREPLQLVMFKPRFLDNVCRMICFS